MFKDLVFLVNILLFSNDLFAKDSIIETNKGKYLLKLKDNKRTGLDYNAPPRQEGCSLKATGPMQQRDVRGGGGKIELRCHGGCLRILKILYSCKEQPNSNTEQLKLVKVMCENKYKCRVKADRRTFGNYERPDAPDEEMNMWIVYRCNGGRDNTTVVGEKKPREPLTIGPMVPPRVTTSNRQVTTSNRQVTTSN